MCKKVLVLMSTYNAEKYLVEQIQSLREQINVQVDILCRDDGSTDNTISLLKNLGIDFYQGKNLGPAGSFMDLVEKCSTDYDFYAFCDQDDYWYPDKLRIATDFLSDNLNCPQLYYSAVNVTDENLNVQYKSFKKMPDTFCEIAFSCGVMQGCTQVFNKTLLLILKKHKPRNFAMHDYYLTLVCKFVGGQFIADKNPQISYRQHHSNTLGIKAKRKAIFVKQYSQTIKEVEFYNEICKLSDKDRKFINEINSYLNNGSGNISLIYDAMKTNYSLKWKITLLKNLALKRF